jgi:hypothetical protein
VGPGGTVPGGTVQTGFETKNPNSNGSKHFQTFSHFGRLENTFPYSEKLKYNMVLKLSKRGTTFSMETSSDSEWIWN